MAAGARGARRFGLAGISGNGAASIDVLRYARDEIAVASAIPAEEATIAGRLVVVKRGAYSRCDFAGTTPASIAARQALRAAARASMEVPQSQSDSCAAAAVGNSAYMSNGQ